MKHQMDSRRLSPFLPHLSSGIASGIAVLILFVLLLGLLNYSLIQALQIVFGSFVVIFLPGWIFSFVFFPYRASLLKDEKSASELDGLERFILALVLSLAIVPLILYVTNRVGIPIQPLTFWIEIAAIHLLGLGLLKFFVAHRL